MKTIVAAVDFSDATEPVTAAAARIARATGARLHLLHIGRPEPDFIGYEPGPDEERQNVAGEMRAEHRKLQELIDRFTGEGLEVDGTMPPGPAAEKILTESRELSAEMIVLGSHGHGALHNLLVGSVSEAVLRHADRPVLVVPVRQR